MTKKQTLSERLRQNPNYQYWLDIQEAADRLEQLEDRNMNGYIAIYNGKRIEIYADCLYSAKVKAIESFRPPKSKRHMISVALAEKDGQQVTHSTVDI